MASLDSLMEARSEDESDAGSLVDFICSSGGESASEEDEGAEGAEGDVPDLPVQLLESFTCTAQGRRRSTRARQVPVRYVDAQYVDLMIDDADIEDVLSSDEGGSGAEARPADEAISDAESYQPSASDDDDDYSADTE